MHEEGVKQKGQGWRREKDVFRECTVSKRPKHICIQCYVRAKFASSSMKIKGTLVSQFISQFMLCGVYRDGRGSVKVSERDTKLRLREL